MREGHLSKNCCHQLTKGRYYAKNPAVRLIHYKNNMTKFDFQNRKAVGQAFQLRPIIRGQKKIELFFRVQIQIRIGIWLPKPRIFAVIFYYQNNCMNYPGISNQSIMKREHNCLMLQKLQLVFGNVEGYTEGWTDRHGN